MKKSVLLMVALMIVAVGAMGATAPTYTNNGPQGSYGTERWELTMLSGSTGNNTGTVVDTRGLSIHNVSITIAGTAVVTVSASYDEGATWKSWAAPTASGDHSWPDFYPDQIKAVISGCSACTVSVDYVGRVR